MKINNAEECCQFLKNNQLIGISSEATALIVCNDELSRLCSCDPADVKIAKFNLCKSLYIAFSSKSTQHKSTLFSKTTDLLISFYIDGQPIITLRRN